MEAFNLEDEIEKWRRYRHYSEGKPEPIKNKKIMNSEYKSAIACVMILFACVIAAVIWAKQRPKPINAQHIDWLGPGRPIRTTIFVRTDGNPQGVVEFGLKSDGTVVWRVIK